MFDNASNMRKASKDAGIPNAGCYAHTLNLIVQDVLKRCTGYEFAQEGTETEEIEESDNGFTIFHKKCKGLATLINKSTNAKREFMQCQKTAKLKNLRLMQDVSTRWNRGAI